MTSDIYNTGQSNVNSAATQGKNALGAFNPNDWQQQTSQGLNNMWGSQNSTQNDYMNAFKNQIMSQPSATSLYGKANDMFNVQPLQNTANQLNNTMLQTPNANLDAAKGFNFDNNQVQQKNSQDLQRLAPAAAAAQNNANTAQGNALNYVNQGMAQNQYELQPTIQQGQYLMDSYARQQTGFTTTQQAQLQALTDKMNQGVALSQSEMQAYSSLSQMEGSYQAALNAASTQLNVAKANTRYQTIPAGQTLVDTKNGVAQKAQ